MAVISTLRQYLAAHLNIDICRVFRPFIPVVMPMNVRRARCLAMRRDAQPTAWLYCMADVIA